MIAASTNLHEIPSIALGAPLDLATAGQFAGTTLFTHVGSLPILPDPVAFLHHASSSLGDGVLWSQGASGRTFAGAGVAAEFVGSGHERFSLACEAFRRLSECVDDQSQLPLPLLGGFSFSPITPRDSAWHDFPNARLLVPLVLLQVADGVAHLRVTIPTSQDTPKEEIDAAVASLLERAGRWARLPGESALPPMSVHRSIPDRAVWEQSVDDAVSLIQRREVAKIVLAREERLTSNQGFNPASVLAALRHANQAATLFAMQSGESWFLGATPERLVRLDMGRVDVTCLAGSIAAGESDAEREALATRLLTSQKDREEHEIVVDSAIEALAGVCTEISRAPHTPRVITARSVQHLETPIVAQAAPGVSVLNLVERLHPTPAVGGYPLAKALQAIERLEEIDRGWYAGPFGWLDLQGDGEFSVAIRSALVTGRTASAFAGCGIVAASDAAAEFRETELKLRPMLSALGAA